ncbi:hypothetical protein Agabi119p4_11071 [Agaricus bisporus var. burnettii]|uniref:Actin-like ATPase domain-containing protein n=1 Tax=Agaricus bisporus var. burnettii TaxID=192524 RepID=A0A8H7C1S2_AGABI|nr:hypothetical protein Agabi119p4_11071 [Agaricus bisporus var. burnettii]
MYHRAISKVAWSVGFSSRSLNLRSSGQVTPSFIMSREATPHPPNASDLSNGITYAILDPGREPEVKPVTKFPGGAAVGGNTKVPTVIYYDPAGTPCVIGEETQREGIDVLAEESKWIKAEWFKLHLRPKTQTTATVSDDIPPLPPGKTAVDLFADFLKYMDQSAKTYVGEHHPTLLSSGQVEYILSHPNAWEGAQQMLMRRAAVQAGLITDTPVDHKRVSFITEGEASLACCVDKGLSIKEGEGVTIVDAGGGTLDISTYGRRGNSDEGYEEIAPAQSYFQGSIFVTRAANRYLTERFEETQFRDDIPFMTEKFDKATKLKFRDPTDPTYMKFGTIRDHDPNLGIRKGQLRLEGYTIGDFFEPSIQCIVDAVVDQQRIASRETRTVFLVGGFGASDYLYAQLRERLLLHQISVLRPDTYLSKAVPDGAIAGYLRPVIYSRIAKYTYGIRSNIIYDATKKGHKDRLSQRFTLLCGEMRLPGGFWTILKKNTKVLDTQEFRSNFFLEASNKSEFAKRRSRQV